MSRADHDRHRGRPAAYVHIPFCSAVCPYCDFAVVAGADDRIGRYVDAVLTEISMTPPWRMLDSVYFGGGTPSHVEPAHLARILDALSANDLRLKIEVIDHGSIIDGFQKVANRIALGLVLAALIVGAAMLMRVPTPFTILGYPGLAMLLFLAAAGGGFWMAWTILAGDVKTRIR